MLPDVKGRVPRLHPPIVLPHWLYWETAADSAAVGHLPMYLYACFYLPVRLYSVCDHPIFIYILNKIEK